jgi:hypothetical protein
MAAVGYVVTERRESIGLKGELWLQENSTLDPNSIRLAWGVRAPAEKPLDGWVFHIRLKTNGSVWLRSMWYETNQVFYERYGSEFNDTFIVNANEKTSRMEWVWYLQNPSSTTVKLYAMHVSYLAVRQPLRSTGIATAAIGLMVSVASISKFTRDRFHPRLRSVPDIVSRSLSLEKASSLSLFSCKVSAHIRLRCLHHFA